ncbi:MAG: ketoacyl-ACP synthase III [Terracidiphilus sp.]|jgi:3-oxoacyl-[acyl-carrier-protein] synthase-3
MRYGNIIGTGAYLPEIEVTNDMLRVQLAHEPGFVDKMEASTGIRTRWYAPEGWATSDLALKAAEKALADAHRTAADLDLIILGTDSPDYITPATSVVLQDKLGARKAGTFDVGCACASFPTGLAIASGLLATNRNLKTILVVGAYMMHKLADPKEKSIFFYGDGAGAAILEPSDKPGFISSAFQADGSYARHWGIYAGGTAEPASVEAVESGRTVVRSLKGYPAEVNEEGWQKLVRSVAAAGEFALSDIDHILFTQVRRKTIEMVVEALGLPVERSHCIMEEQGYTGSACVAMALDEARKMGKIAPGSLLVMVGSGVGYNQAAVAFRWQI